MCVVSSPKNDISKSLELQFFIRHCFLSVAILCFVFADNISVSLAGWNARKGQRWNGNIFLFWSRYHSSACPKTSCFWASSFQVCPDIIYFLSSIFLKLHLFFVVCFINQIFVSEFVSLCEWVWVLRNFKAQVIVLGCKCYQFPRKPKTFKKKNQCCWNIILTE